ncbi:EthD domain-containing protein [Mycolicibacterium litorale]|uniref:EthD domain-containing protein n=1 Tax=Mycolicibacterium litorale TaxID=758802 RepID=UPI003CEB5D45
MSILLCVVTLIMFIRKRPDLTRDEFIDYYETKHIELIGRLVGGRPTSYRRHYAVGPGYRTHSCGDWPMRAVTASSAMS